jgi:hypothetical protein
MRIPAALCTALTAIGVSTFALSAAAQDHEHPMTGSAAIQGDSRILVKFPEPMRLHTITSMRDHLLALQEIAVALSKNAFDKAASIAGQRLGISSLELHGAAHLQVPTTDGLKIRGSQSISSCRENQNGATRTPSWSILATV